MIDVDFHKPPIPVNPELTNTQFTPDFRPALAITGIVDLTASLIPRRATECPEMTEPKFINVSDILLDKIGIPGELLRELLVEHNGKAVIAGSIGRLIGYAGSIYDSDPEIDDLLPDSMTNVGRYRSNGNYSQAPIHYPIKDVSDLDIIVFDPSTAPSEAILCRSLIGGRKKTEQIINEGKSYTVSTLYAPKHLCDWPTSWGNWLRGFNISGLDSCTYLNPEGNLQAFLPGGSWGVRDRSYNTIFSPETKLDPRNGAWAIRHGIYMAYFAAIDRVNLTKACKFSTGLGTIDLDDKALKSISELFCKLIITCDSYYPDDSSRFREGLSKMGLMGVIQETVNRFGDMVSLVEGKHVFTLNDLYNRLTKSR